MLQMLMWKCKFRLIIAYIWFFSTEYCFTLDLLDCWTSRLSNKHIWCCSDGSEESGRTLWWNPEACGIFLSTSHHALDLTAFRYGVKTSHINICCLLTSICISCSEKKQLNFIHFLKKIFLSKEFWKKNLVKKKKTRSPLLTWIKHFKTSKMPVISVPTLMAFT